MNPIDQTSRRRRRIILPVVVLLIAGGIAWWASQRETQRMADIRQMVLGLCKFTAAGEDLAGRLNADPFVAQQVAGNLRTVCKSPQILPSLEVAVFPGDLDVTIAGSAAEQATHSAIVRIDGVDRLGLRLRHDGQRTRIVILGYWLP
jgi:hypothetical protein